MDIRIKKSTVDLLARLLQPLTDAGALSHAEEREIISQLRHLSKTGELIPVIVPKLIDQPTTAEMIGISLANFKKIERSGKLPLSENKSEPLFVTATRTW